MIAYRSQDATLLLTVAARNINNALTWDKTPEGREYWEEVSQRLQNHASLADGKNAPYPHRMTTPTGKAGNTSPAESITKKAEAEIHVFHGGDAICRSVSSDPRTWPVGHTRVYLKDWKAATCKGCLKNITKDMIKEVEQDEKGKISSV